ncbi:MAG: FAD-dependent oxidoreductase [Gammaproteobacteria bacterium]
MQQAKKRVLIVGGVAGGASCAARLRRLCEQCEIVLIDKGEHVSFANCGLPYFVGDVIKEERKLLLATPDLFQNRFNIQVLIRHEMTAIDRARKTVAVTDLLSGTRREEPYDALVLSTGAAAVTPPLPGIDLPGIHVLRTIPDSQKLKAAAQTAKRAVIIGAGFIGLEMAENLAGLGLQVTLIEMAPQVMPPLDAEMAGYVSSCLQAHHIRLILGCAVQAFERTDDGLQVVYNGGRLDTDMVLLAIGVKPASELARQAGLEIGRRGGIRVDNRQQTSDPSIWAVGDVVEVEDFISRQQTTVPLAGPANRQGRIAAASILEAFNPELNRQQHFRGVQGTSVCRVFDLTIALTGSSEKALQKAGAENYRAVYLHPGHHAGYYPGAEPIHMKLLYATPGGKILGVQAVGKAGVTRRVDVIAMAIQMGATVFDLEESELCYAPQFGGAKDPVNMAGMIAANNLRGDLELADWRRLHDSRYTLLDVRSSAEFAAGHVANAVNIPLEELRRRKDELPCDREIWLLCGVGQRAYYAVRLLMQQGFQVRVLSGGMQTYQALLKAGFWQ